MTSVSSASFDSSIHCSLQQLLKSAINSFDPVMNSVSLNHAKVQEENHELLRDLHSLCQSHVKQKANQSDSKQQDSLFKINTINTHLSGSNRLPLVTDALADIIASRGPPKLEHGWDRWLALTEHEKGSLLFEAATMIDQACRDSAVAQNKLAFMKTMTAPGSECVDSSKTFVSSIKEQSALATELQEAVETKAIWEANLWKWDSMMNTRLTSPTTLRQILDRGVPA